mgnify:CR=1 FL=1
MNRAKIGDLCNLYSGGTPSTKCSEYWGGNFPWLSSAVSNQDFIYSSEITITQEGIDNSATRLAKKNSVLIATAGEGKTRGQVSYLEIDAYINQSLISIVPKKDITALYLYYYLKNSYGRIRKLSDITGIRGSLSGDLLKSFIIEYPDLDTQKKITTTLRTIDRNIENNKKIINELESMAKTLYDYWFLQFEFPNEQGKPYKSSGGRTVWNEELKIEIPEGWKVSKIGDILEEANKSKIQVNDAKEKGKYPFFTSGEKILCYDDYLVKGFNIFLNTGGNPDIKAYMGKCAYSTDTWCVSAKEYSYILFYYLLKLMPQFEQLFFAGSGLKHLQKDSLKNQYILLPDEKVLRNFNNICELIWKKITNCLIENQELTALRDFLLPLLMNGQVTFKE